MDEAQLSRFPRPRALFVSVAYVVVAVVASLGGSAFIAARFPDRPRAHDLLFELLPYLPEARYASAIALVAGFILFAWYAFIIAPAQLPKMMCVLASMYILRAALMVLTPLADAYGDGAFAFPVVQHGMFPSGHAAAMLLLVLLTERKRAPRIHAGLVVGVAILCVSMILAHGHYSIDIAGALLLAYFCEREWRHGKLFNPLKRALGA